MRISEERYSRDLRRVSLAAKFIQHEVRTGLVLRWTGLPARRLRNLWDQMKERAASAAVKRHRGPPPTNPKIFFDTDTRCDEASAIGVLCRSFQVLPAARGPQAVKGLASLERGERVCAAYETYLQLVPNPEFSLDQVLLLIEVLTLGEAIELTQCPQCSASILFDRQGSEAMLCTACSKGLTRQRRRRVIHDLGEEVDEVDDFLGEVQGSLF